MHESYNIFVQVLIKTALKFENMIIKDKHSILNTSSLQSYEEKTKKTNKQQGFTDTVNSRLYPLAKSSQIFLWCVKYILLTGIIKTDKGLSFTPFVTTNVKKHIQNCMQSCKHTIYHRKKDDD